jgi:hypothetical protein
MPYNAIAIKRKDLNRMGSSITPSGIIWTDPVTGAEVSAESSHDSWIGWSIILSAISAGTQKWEELRDQKRAYQQAGYKFPKLTQTSYNSQYAMLKSVYPNASDEDIRRLLEPSSSTGDIPTWVWVALAAAGVLVIISIMKKKA